MSAPQNITQANGEPDTTIPEYWRRRAALHADKAHTASSEAAALMSAARSIAYSLLVLAHQERR